MPIADSKKVHSMINVVGQQAEIIRAAVQTMKDIRAAFNLIDPDITGTPLVGNKTAVSNSIDALDTEINQAVWTQMIDVVIPSHPNNLLE